MPGSQTTEPAWPEPNKLPRFVFPNLAISDRCAFATVRNREKHRTPNSSPGLSMHDSQGTETDSPEPNSLPRLGIHFSRHSGKLILPTFQNDETVNPGILRRICHSLCHRAVDRYHLPRQVARLLRDQVGDQAGDFFGSAAPLHRTMLATMLSGTAASVPGVAMIPGATALTVMPRLRPRAPAPWSRRAARLSPRHS